MDEKIRTVYQDLRMVAIVEALKFLARWLGVVIVLALPNGPAARLEYEAGWAKVEKGLEHVAEFHPR